MAIAFVQNLGNLSTGSATFLTGTFASPTVNGNFIATSTRVGATGRTVTVDDNKTNTYAQAKNQVQTTDASEIFCHYAMDILGGASHLVTSSISGAAASIRLTLHEYSGIATSAALDQTNGSEGDAGTALSSGNITTTQADELLFGAGGNSASGTLSLGTDYSNLAVSLSAAGLHRLGAEDRIVASTGTYSATFTNSPSTNWMCLIASFKMAGKAPPLSSRTIPPALLAM